MLVYAERKKRKRFSEKEWQSTFTPKKKNEDGHKIILTNKNTATGLPELRSLTGIELAMGMQQTVDILDEKLEKAIRQDVIKRLEKGILRTTDGKLVKTKRIIDYGGLETITKNGGLSKGVKYNGLKRGVNYGYKTKEGVTVTTKAINQQIALENKLFKKALSGLKLAGFVFEYVGLAQAMVYNDFSRMNPIGFIGDDEFDKLDRIMDAHAYKQLQEAKTKGAEAVEALIRRVGILEREYVIMRLNKDIVNQVLSRTIQNEEQLYEAISYVQEVNAFILFKRKINGDLVIDTIFS